MAEDTAACVAHPGLLGQDPLTELLRAGAQQLLATAIEAEVADYIERHADLRDKKGLRLVVRNGHQPERDLQTPLGPVTLRQPRVEDRRVDAAGNRVRFTSALLPRYLRRTKSLDGLIPWLYLKGVSTGDFSEALAALLGSEAPGFSPSTVVRLKEVWEGEFQEWSRRSLCGQRYVYFWVDGVYANIRLEDERVCLLVVIGATAEGRKELVAVQDGFRESEQSWVDLLEDLKSRGLVHGPELAIGDGALGFWKALAKVYPRTRHQRCWFHKAANVLNHFPDRSQPAANKALQQIWMAAIKGEAEKAMDSFRRAYNAKYPKAVQCLEKDRSELLAFYDFPAQHWTHLRTTNPIESTFATVRLRTAKTKGAGSRVACLTMVWKLVQAAERGWRYLNGAPQLLEDLVAGIRFKDGIKEVAA